MAACKDSKRRDDLFKFAKAYERQARLQAMIALAEPELTVRPEELDCNPMVLNCNSGVIDLTTGELRAHDRADMITRLAPAAYIPDADQVNEPTANMWTSFLFDATNNDANLIMFLQRCAGYSLTGNTGEEKLFMIHGPGAAGKSTFLDALKATLGDYSQQSDFESFVLHDRAGGIRNDIAELVGRRMVVSVEVERGKRLAEALVKQLVGGDMVRARFLRREFFEFRPQFKLWLAVNHPPKVDNTDSATWRRILRIPFEHVIPEAERDPKVKATLSDPSQAGVAVLAWAVRGAVAWHKHRLEVPATVTQATEDYRQSMNPLGGFFEDCCGFYEGAQVTVADLRQAYKTYCETEGIRHPLGPARFNEQLRERGCEAKVLRIGDRTHKGFIGIELQKTNTQA